MSEGTAAPRPVSADAETNRAREVETPPGSDLLRFPVTASDDRNPSRITIGEQRFPDSATARSSSLAPELLHVGDLLTEAIGDADDDWLVDGLLIRGGTSLVVAKPKAGKTTLARAIALAVSRGDICLGRATHRGRVIMLGFEEHQKWLQRALRSMGVTASDEIYLHLGEAPREGVEWLRALVMSHRPVLVVVDPLLKLVRAQDANDYAQMSRLLEPLNTIARHSGAHLMLVHHASKGERLEGESALGSTAFTALVDSIVALTRHPDGRRTLKTRQRYGEDCEIALELDPETQTVYAGSPHSRGSQPDIRAEIANVVGNSELPLTAAEVRAKVGRGMEAVRNALNEAVNSGELQRRGTGTRGDQFLFGFETQFSLLRDRNESGKSVREEVPPAQNGA